MEREKFDEIIKQPRGEREGIMVSMRMIAKRCPISFLNSKDNKLFYECKVEDVLNSAITEEELSDAITKGWWEISNDSKNLILKI